MHLPVTLKDKDCDSTGGTYLTVTVLEACGQSVLGVHICCTDCSFRPGPCRHADPLNAFPLRGRPAVRLVCGRSSLLHLIPTLGNMQDLEVLVLRGTRVRQAAADRLRLQLPRLHTVTVDLHPA